MVQLARKVFDDSIIVRPWRKPATRWLASVSDALRRNPATGIAGCCALRERPRSRRAAECSQQFPPSDGNCHTPLPREVRRGKDTTPRPCSLAVQGGQDSGCFTSVVLHLPLMPNSNERNAPTAIGYSG